MSTMDNFCLGLHGARILQVQSAVFIIMVYQMMIAVMAGPVYMTIILIPILFLQIEQATILKVL